MSDWMNGFFPLSGDTLNMRCATEGCGQRVSVRMEFGGIGSDYCEPCARKIEAHLAKQALGEPTPPADGEGEGMSERPIIFSGPMVKALLDGRKSQTRRILKPQIVCHTGPVPAFTWGKFSGLYPDDWFGYGNEIDGALPYAVGDRLWCIQFRPIQFGNGKYAVGDDGNLYDVSPPTPRRRIVRLSHNGYEEISLRYQGESQSFRISRLVAEAFYGSPKDGEVCRHLDNNRRNNIPQNLDWGTPAQNSGDAVAAGSFAGEMASKAKLSLCDVTAIRLSNEPQAVLAARYGVTQPTISKIKGGKRWFGQNVTPPSRNRPIEFSRITLEVTEVRVQRLREISEEDAKAEGVERRAWEAMPLTNLPDGYRCGFAELWTSLHGPDAWAANPWVCCLTFKRVE